MTKYQALHPYSPSYGGKAAGLSKLNSLHCRVPRGMVLPAGETCRLSRLSSDELSRDTVYLELVEYAATFWQEGRRVILRSSAESEDAGGSSFAGQFTSTPDLHDERSLRNGLLQVFSGYQSAQGQVYREKFVAEPFVWDLHIIIQEFVQASAAGVCFGCNPINGDGDVIQVSVVAGFGGRLVEGQETGASATIDKRSGALLTGSLPSAVLCHVAELRRLIRTLDTAERGYYSDIEFALSNGMLHVVQWRPITTVIRLKDVPRQGSFGRDLLGEWLTDPMSSIFETLFLPKIIACAREEFDRVLGLRFKTPEYITHRGYLYLRQELPWSLLRALVRLPRFMASGLHYWTTERDVLVRKIESFPVAPSSTERGVLIREVETLVHLSCQLMAISLSTVVLAIGSEVIYRVLYRTVCVTESELDYLRLLQSGSSRSHQAAEFLTEIGSALRAAGVRSASDLPAALGDLPESVRLPISRYLDAYGHLAGNFDISARTVREESYWLSSALSISADSDLLKKRPSAAPAEGELRFRSLIRPISPVRALARFVLKKSAQLASAYQGIRDDRAFYAQYGWDRIRFRLRELYRVDARTDPLRSEDEFYDHSWSDIVASRYRRTAVRRDGGVAMIPELGVNNPWYIRLLRRRIWYGRERSPGEGSYSGQPGSPGLAVGPAFVADSLPELERVQQGSILVCKATTPAWTSAFGLLGGVVTEIGNPLSHAAIVAREYGIPCVVGIPNARSLFLGRPSLKVDGTHGIVTAMNRASTQS